MFTFRNVPLLSFIINNGLFFNNSVNLVHNVFKADMIFMKFTTVRAISLKSFSELHAFTHQSVNV